MMCRQRPSSGTRSISGMVYLCMLSYLQSHQSIIPSIFPSIKPLLRVEAEAESLLNTPRSSLPLRRARFRHENLFEAAQLTALCIPTQPLNGSMRNSLHRYLISFALPQSMTNTTSGIVIPVSAMFVASTIFLTPGGGTSNAALWLSDDRTE